MEKENQHILKMIEGCRRNDRRSQEMLYREYYRSMMSICIRYVNNEEDAVEVLNNGFFKVFRNIGQFDQRKAGLYTWIRTIVVNSCIDHVRSKQQEEANKELDENADVHIEPEVIKNIRLLALLDLVRKLPKSTMAVFNLYAIEGYGHKEIGKLLGISEGTSKWHLSEARKHLQKMIQQKDVKIYE